MATINGDDLGNTLDGTTSNDVINGFGGIDLLRGLEGNDSINGGTGNDTLDGGTGNDTLVGDFGGDTYFVDSVGDVVIETNNQGVGDDQVRSSISYSLGANVENLLLLGTASINGIGNSLDNRIEGNSGDNTLDGGAGIDRLLGGDGNDTYIIDHESEIIFDNSGNGIDTVLAYVSYSLGGNLEIFRLLGSAANGFGNSRDNTIFGNSLNNILTGENGDDVLNGGAGNDTLIGGSGNDTYIVDSVGDVVTETATITTEIDTVESLVSFSLGANLENLILTGTASINGTGNTLNNTITGNSGNNILNGGLGADQLVGGAGNDTYIVDNVGDSVIESAGAGIDTVQSAISYSLGANLENLILLGADSINGIGNTLNNTITGNAGNNFINGDIGNDLLNGGAGNDTLVGGVGNDTYVVDSVGDIVSETSTITTEIDTVQSAISYSLGANLENLILLGTTSINGTGNGLNNTITGNSGNNSLNGGAGNDVLNGGAGADQLVGDTGNDTYTVDNLGDVVTESANAGIDIVQSLISYSLGANLENLILLGTASINGIGNTLNNSITGNSANNTLNGGAGADQLVGGTGDDLYFVDDVGDGVIESTSAGTDTVQSAISYSLGANLENLILIGSAPINGIGNTLNNVITGNGGSNSLNGGSGNDVLNGGTGADQLVGGTGDDLYFVDDVGDGVIESTSAGTDTVQSAISYSLGANLENLILTGSAAINGIGNTLNNTITGNSGNNSLNGDSGNDVLNGGAGADQLVGGTGDDLYFVDNIGDVTVESASGGLDTVQSLISHALTANLENLILLGTASINGTGNTLNNTITGNSGSNTLNGGLGVDRLVGGLGNDTYVRDNLGDVIVENASQGTDTVQSFLTYSLGANLENLMLIGSSNINGTGNTLNNTITGNAGNNTLNGGFGVDRLIGEGGNDLLVGGSSNDSLTGGAGNDFFRFNARTEALDTITDFSKVSGNIDKIQVLASGFGGGLTAGVLATTRFHLGSSATTTTHRFIYNQSTGALFFDVDGLGGTGQVQIASLTTKPGLVATDIIVV